MKLWSVRVVVQGMIERVAFKVLVPASNKTKAEKAAESLPVVTGSGKVDSGLTQAEQIDVSKGVVIDRHSTFRGSQ